VPPAAPHPPAGHYHLDHPRRPTPAPTVVDRATGQAAQDAAAAHCTSRDGDEANTHSRHLPVLTRSRIWCRDCPRRMTGTTYDNPGGTITYYRCPHNPATGRSGSTQLKFSQGCAI
jgi:hypothetical protein